LETGSFPTSISLSCRSVAAKISCFVYLLYFIFLGFDKPDMYLYLLKHLGSVFIQQTDFFFQVFFFWTNNLSCITFNAVNMPGKQRDFGGFDGEDDQAVLLKPGSKPLTQIVQDDSFREFEFRQYLFACQSRVGAHKRHHIDHSVLFSFQNCSFTFTTFSLAYLYVVLCSCCSSWIVHLKLHLGDILLLLVLQRPWPFMR